LESVSIFLKILKSINNPRSKAKLEENNQSILESLIIFKDGCTYCFWEVDSSTWMNLAVSSTFSFVKTSISSKFEIFYKIVYIIFCRYNFFCCWKRETFIEAFFNSDSKRICWDTMFWNWEDAIFITLQPNLFDCIQWMYRDDSNGDTS